MFRSSLLLSFLVFSSTFLLGKHIIGGVVTYECLGGGTYRFTCKVYRDCTDPTGANFDFAPPFSIYRNDEQTPIQTYYPQLDGPINDIDPPEDPCLELPPNVCVEEGQYVFEHTFLDWPSTNTYTVSYQRCCRNNSITNVVAPGSIGATFTVELTPEAQMVADSCNSTPVFNDFPPIVICQGEEIDFNHAATDPDGDQLVYSLCAPFTGGGLEGTAGNPGNPTGCNGVFPDPACPPPYNTVNFINPPYNTFNPLGSAVPVTIDPNTGQLTGVADQLGQFVVGVCVTEIRDGVTLGTVRRDFQFNVGNCENSFVALIDTDDNFTIDGTPLLESCGDTIFTLNNNSVVNATLDDFYWEFDLDGTPTTFTEWSPTITFPGFGTYQGQLFLNPGSPCGDTATVEVRVFNQVIADFRVDYDTCVSGPVAFLNESTLSGDLRLVEWDLGVGGVDTSRFPVYEYDEPGMYSVDMYVEDTNGCNADTTKIITYQPAPAFIVIAPNDQRGCPPADIEFLNRSAPIDDTYDIVWTFGDGDTARAISPTHTYETTGWFDIGLSITSPAGCTADTVFEQLVEIVPPPVADFTYSPNFFSNLQPNITLTDASTDAVRWDWFMDGQIIASQQDLQYAFPDTGQVEVMLVVTHEEFCQDTFLQLVDVLPETRWHLPNAFTPNGDGRNDQFGGRGVLLGATEFQLRVFNRYGQVVFETSDPNGTWDGFATTEDPAAGVYVWEVRYREGRGNLVQERGFVTLIL